jgi:hypothetical protein
LYDRFCSARTCSLRTSGEVEAERATGERELPLSPTRARSTAT